MTFSGSPLDPADRLRGDKAWLNERLAHAQSRFLPMWKLMALVTVAEPHSLVWLSGATLTALAPKALASGVIFLGLQGDIAHFAVDLDGGLNNLAPNNNLALSEEPPLSHLGQFVEVRAAAGFLREAESAIIARTRAMIDWHQRHHFCANCGVATEVTRGGYQRQCPACLAPHFPRVDPVVIMLIVRGDQCLLGRQSRFPAGMYSALAGFIEPGETIEEAVRRESLEEAGIIIGDVRYRASQPWPFPANLMIGCEAEALSDKIIPDHVELEDAVWKSRGDIRRALEGDKNLGFFLPPPLAIAHHLACDWALRD